MSNLKLRVWAEYFSPQDAIQKKTIKLLKKYNVNLSINFPPTALNDNYAKMLSKYTEEGIEVALWVLLSDESGYWIHEQNADIFHQHLEKIFDWADKNQLCIPWIAVDLEPPYYLLQKIEQSPWYQTIPEILKILHENRNPKRFASATKKFRKILELIHNNKAKTLAAVSNLVAEDIVTKQKNIQDLSETPVSTVEWDVLSFMIYNSMSVGYSKGFISYRDSRWYLYDVCKDMKRKLGERAAISIGTTYIGKLGNEPYYQNPEDILPDVEAVLAAGINDIAIYNLEGILHSKKPEKWFDCVLDAMPKVPKRSFKADLFRKTLQAIDKYIL